MEDISAVPLLREFLVYLAARQNVVWAASLVTLEILKVNKLSLYRALGNGLRELILLSARVRH